jgi:1,4-alpha-glucan branching enzyme
MSMSTHPDRADGAGVIVTFRLPESVVAEHACVVGDFNDWSPTADPMERDGDAFVAALTLAPGRSYRFRYLLDGERWENDWAADAYLPNEFGGDDSVIDLTSAGASVPPSEHGVDGAPSTPDPKPPRTRKRATKKAAS